MEYSKPIVTKMDLGVEHCMCGSVLDRLAVAVDLGT